MMITNLLAVAMLLASTAFENRLRDGDIIFHESRSSQSRAIQLATKSRYSHMGILYRDGKRWFVYEAVQPVKLTPLDAWIRRGKDGHFVVKRLRDPLPSATLRRMKTAGARYRGRGYDLYFEWSDERIYCSELVWKIYKEGAGIELGRLQKLREFDLSHPAVRAKMRERYGNRVPANEPVISPSAMFEAKELVEVLRR
ncbi:MAG TPA: YiiX family permuted papain-like enzyme [Thermoanaerobaculia bacterium]|nr:YiiX family permuted papain-like enzyme [Thermoanaerobaculia bacterium]